LNREASPLDERFMRRALELAHESVGVASPNPVVGCVLVKDENIIGEGFHSYDLRDHAEIVALTSAGSAAQGSTAYVTLEPCSHTGRTGPCADALINAGIARVVVATSDPNPSVNGEGIARMRNAGITVDVGIFEQEACDLNDGFARYIRTRLPFVTLKAGLSLDGRIAPAPETRAPETGTLGAAVMLTGPKSQAEVHRMRHASDAIITGINTVLTDNPLLTDRSGLPRRRPLLRVVLDSTLRLPLDSRLVETANDDLIVFCTTASADRRRALESLHIRVEQIEAQTDAEPNTNRVSLPRVLERLGELEITAALLEAGSQLNAAALHLVDKVTLFYAPIFLGRDAIPLLHTADSLNLQPLRTTITQFGPDFRLEAWLRDPWLDMPPP
jgi:diaminohydroxyphosphoribosylaminopyrimidine deaminase / 5-amino-6-(5-phosphoribosylamino)uracil reductase